jgi:hypothetical protein
VTRGWSHRSSSHVRTASSFGGGHPMWIITQEGFCSVTPYDRQHGGERSDADELIIVRDQSACGPGADHRVDRGGDLAPSVAGNALPCRPGIGNRFHPRRVRELEWVGEGLPPLFLCNDGIKPKGVAVTRNAVVKRAVA